MIEFLLSLSTWTGCVVMMGFTTVVGFVVYLVFNKFFSKYKREDVQDLINNIFRVVGTLVSLMLALAFSEVIVELRTIRNAVQREAVAISDTFEVLKLFDNEKTREIRTILVEYTQAVINHDWPALANDKLSQRTSTLKRQFTEAVMSLEPATPTQEKLWSLIVTDIDALSDHRISRLDAALAGPPIYVNVMIFGFLVTMACFGAYRPQATLVVLISLYTVFVGLVLFLIVKLSDPFQGDIGVTPAAFEYLVETLQSEIR